MDAALAARVELRELAVPKNMQDFGELYLQRS